MSRTYRRKNNSYEYYWVLRDWDSYRAPYWTAVNYERNSAAAKKAIAIYHSDATRTMSGSAPRSYCKIRHHRLRQTSRREIHRFLRDHEYEVQIQVNHKHSATWDYW